MAAAVLAAHSGALVCLALIELPSWVHALAGAVIIMNLARHWRHAFWWKDSVLRITTDGLCVLAGDDASPAGILGADVFAGFVRLRLARVSGWPRTLLVAKDAVSPEVYHELCARIRQGRLPWFEKHQLFGKAEQSR